MDRNRRERTSPATNNRIFHPAQATSFPYVRVAHSPADTIPFVLIRSSFLRSFARHMFGLRHQYLILTISRCSRVHREPALFAVATHAVTHSRGDRAS